MGLHKQANCDLFSSADLCLQIIKNAAHERIQGGRKKALYVVTAVLQRCADLTRKDAELI